MALALLLLLPGICGALAWYLWWRRHRARQQRIDALIRLHVAGMQARQRLAVYEVLAHRAIEAEIVHARRQLQRWGC